MLHSCNVEEEVIQETTFQNYTFSKEDFNELMKTYNFSNAMSKIPKKKVRTKNATGRSEMEDKYGFTIDQNAQVNITKTDSITAYNIQIKNDTLTEGKFFENLVINTNKFTADTNIYIIKYNLLSAINISEHNTYMFDYTTEITPLVSKYGEICWDLHVLMCNYGGHEHIAGNNCQNGNYLYLETQPTCIQGQTGQGGTGVPSYGNGSYGGNPIISNPNPICQTCSLVNSNDPKPPCEILTPLTAEQKIINSINFLKPKTETKLESAYEVTNSINYDGSLSINSTFIQGQNLITEVPTGQNVIGAIHNHPKNGMSIPSWGDVLWLMNCENSNYTRNDGTAFSIVIVKNMSNPTGDPIIYAITVTDIAALQNQINADLSSPEIVKLLTIESKRDALNKEMGKKYADVQENTQGLERKFLEHYQNYGIALSKFDAGQNKWNKLSLQNPYNPQTPNATNTVVAEPCN